MKLSDIKTLKEISDQYNIPVVTLKKRVKLKSLGMIENEDYRSLGERQAMILSPEGVKKIISK
ncbi:hypothetical protein [Clostridium tagluense]|uniref:hypothetical protein n=1 Tax=Clostridium tagluense TaxID=360422 RepID=UPI001CF49AC8|nr:hypothetical protein [Clostridium tagluense]MCB2300422.1 hypothetical protein [Clostridium tagluense]